MPLQFSAGEAFQFDWSEDWAMIDGVNTKLQVAHFKLSYSRAFILRAYLLQSHDHPARPHPSIDHLQPWGLHWFRLQRQSHHS